MQIKELTVTNLKGLNITDEKLGAETLICGPNFTGKTARMQAIQLGLLGYIPGRPRTNPGIYSLASGKSMYVALSAGDGWARQIRIEKSGKSVERFHSGATFDDEAMPPLIAMLDAEKFLAASGPGKLDMVWTLANVETKESIESVCAKLPDKIHDALGEEDNAPTPIQEWIGWALEKVKDYFKASKQVADRMAKTQQGIVALEKEDAPVLNSAEIATEINGLQDQLTPLRQRQTEIVTLNQSFMSAKAKFDRDMANYKNVLEAMEGKKELVKKKPALEKLIGNLLKTMSLPGDDVMVIQANLSKVIGSIAGAESVYRQIVADVAKATAEELTLEEMECCPHCHSKGKGWKKILAEGIAEKLNELSKRDNEQHKIIGDLVAEREILKSDLEKAREIARLNQENATARQSAQSDLRRIEDAEKDLQRAPVAPDPLAHPEDTADEEMHLANEIEDLLVKIDVKRTEQRMADQATARNATAAQAVLAAQENEVHLENCKKAIEVLEEVRDKMVDAAFAGLLETAEPVFRGILKTPLEYRNGEIGRQGENGFISMDTFSGTEALLATVAIQVALGARSKAKIVLIDELGRVDRDNKNKLIENLHGMIIKKQIDQWIALDVEIPTKKSKIITIIETTKLD